jgi:hypothetical protein
VRLRVVFCSSLIESMQTEVAGSGGLGVTRILTRAGLYTFSLKHSAFLFIPLHSLG